MIRTNKNQNNTYKNNKKYDVIMNDKIFLSKFLLLNDKGEKLGSYNKRDALDLATSQNKDLILIYENKNNPDLSICKIIEYGKYIYNQKKKEKNQKQVVHKTKELKISVATNLNDLNWNINNVLRWLKDKDNVKISIKCIGRFANKPELVYSMYDKFMELLKFKNNGIECKNEDVLNYIKNAKIKNEAYGLEIKIEKELKKITPFLYESVIRS